MYRTSKHDPVIVLVTRLFVVYAPSRAMSLEDSLTPIVEALMITSTCNKASSTCTIGSSRSKLGMSPSFGVAAEEIISSYGASSLKGLQTGPSSWHENLFVVPPDNTNYSFYSSTNLQLGRSARLKKHSCRGSESFLFRTTLSSSGSSPLPARPKSQNLTRCLDQDEESDN